MATRKQVTQEFIPSDNDERTAQIMAARGMPDTPPAIMERPEPEIYEETEDEILANVIADLGGPGIDAKVNVYQLDQNRNKAFVRAYLPAEFSLESIQSEYGSGDYEIHVRKDGRLATRKVVKIAAPKTPPNVMIPSQVTGISDAKILETMQNGFKEMGAMFANALSSLTANQPKPKSTMEMLQEMQLMREIMGGNSPAQPATNPMEIITLAKELAETITPRVGEPGTGEVIMSALKTVAPMLQNAMVAQAQNMPAPMPAPQIPAIQQNPIAQPAQNPQGDDMNFARKMFLNMLISNAKADNEPSTYAAMIIDMTGEEKAREFSAAPDWFEQLCKEEPRAIDYREWFQELKDSVEEMLKPDAQEPGLTTDNSPVKTGETVQKT